MLPYHPICAGWTPSPAYRCPPGTLKCHGNCLRPLSETECPLDPDLPDCNSNLVPPWGLCEADYVTHHECGTTDINNCDPGHYDVYQIMPGCSDTTCNFPPTPALSPRPPPPPPRPPDMSYSCPTGTEKCRGYCLRPLKVDECPWHVASTLRDAHCHLGLMTYGVPLDGLCEADFECGSDDLNNCEWVFDVYQIISRCTDIACTLPPSSGASQVPPPASLPIPPAPPPSPPLPSPPYACPLGMLRCFGNCLLLLDAADCPDATTSRDLPNCHMNNVDDLCEGDGECGTSNDIDNCPGLWDVYKIVASTRIDTPPYPPSLPPLTPPQLPLHSPLPPPPPLPRDSSPPQSTPTPSPALALTEPISEGSSIGSGTPSASVELMASGSMEDYPEVRQRQILADVAALAGFATVPAGSTIRMLPASVRIEVILSLENVDADFAVVRESLAAKLATAEDASVALSITVESVPTIRQVLSSDGSNDQGYASALVVDGNSSSAGLTSGSSKLMDIPWVIVISALVVAALALVAGCVVCGRLYDSPCGRLQIRRKRRAMAQVNRQSPNRFAQGTSTGVQLGIEPLRTHVHGMDFESNTSFGYPFPTVAVHETNHASDKDEHLDRADSVETAAFGIAAPAYDAVAATGLEHMEMDIDVDRI